VSQDEQRGCHPRRNLNLHHLSLRNLKLSNLNLFKFNIPISAFANVIDCGLSSRCPNAAGNVVTNE
jgi:hypothetical protein